jgi:hypothetical protein
MKRDVVAATHYFLLVNGRIENFVPRRVPIDSTPTIEVYQKKIV